MAYSINDSGLFYKAFDGRKVKGTTSGDNGAQVDIRFKSQVVTTNQGACWEVDLKCDWSKDGKWEKSIFLYF